MLLVRFRGAGRHISLPLDSIRRTGYGVGGGASFIPMYVAQLRIKSKKFYFPDVLN